MNDEVDGRTFKKLKIRLIREKNLLIESKQEMEKGNLTSKLARLEKLMPTLSSLKQVYEMSSLQRKQLLIRGVFKHKLTYFDGAFRTPKIDEALAHNALKAK